MNTEITFPAITREPSSHLWVSIGSADGLSVRFVIARPSGRGGVAKHKLIGMGFEPNVKVSYSK